MRSGTQLFKQNYLVYVNSEMFISNGGNSRVAGFMLAAATFGVLIAGPDMIGYVPVMVVGALIYYLGIALLEEALVDTWGKMHRLEYLTVSQTLNRTRQLCTKRLLGRCNRVDHGRL